MSQLRAAACALPNAVYISQLRVRCIGRQHPMSINTASHSSLRLSEISSSSGHLNDLVAVTLCQRSSFDSKSFTEVTINLVISYLNSVTCQHLNIESDRRFRVVRRLRTKNSLNVIYNLPLLQLQLELEEVAIDISIISMYIYSN